MKKSMIAISVASALTLFISGCGSDDDVSTSTGYLVDAPVVGVNYNCGSTTGLTGENGKFAYAPGSECTFSIGKVILGKANPDDGKKGAGFVTPLDLADANTTTDPNVVKITQLILSVDSDDNASNGIQVDDTAVEDLNKLDKEVDLSSPDVTLDTLQTDLQSAGVTDAEFVSTTVAESHLSDLDNAINEVKAAEGIETDTDTNTDANTDTDTNDMEDNATTDDTTADTGNCLPGQDCSSTTSDTTSDTTADTGTCLPGQDCSSTTSDTTSDTTTDTTTDTNTTSDTTDSTATTCLPGQAC